MTFRVLDVGSKTFNNAERAHKDYPDLEVLRLDIDPDVGADIVHDMTTEIPPELREAFDVVYCSHMLEHISWRQVAWTLKNISDCVKPGGKLVIIVPDLEWACSMIMRNNYNFGVLGVLYGGQMNEWEYHRTGFTERSLAAIFKKIPGFRVVSMVHEPFLSIVNDNRDTCYQITCVAERES